MKKIVIAAIICLLVLVAVLAACTKAPNDLLSERYTDLAADASYAAASGESIRPSERKGEGDGGFSLLLSEKRTFNSALIGASRPEQILENVKALDAAPFTPAELAAIDAILAYRYTVCDKSGKKEHVCRRDQKN